MNDLSRFSPAAVIFDMDGTLLDSMPLWHDVGSRYLVSLGLPPDPALDAQLFQMTMAEGADYLAAHYPVHRTSQQIRDEVSDLVFTAYAEEIPLKPGMHELLDALSDRQIPFALATASDRPLAEAALARLGILDRFAAICTATEVGIGKHSPALFDAARAALGNPPAVSVWVFEDALHAAETAHAAGYPVCIITDSESRANWDALRRISDFFCTDAADLAALSATLENQPNTSV